MKLIKKLLLLLCCLFTFFNFVFGQEIMLKKSFFGGWQFSADGYNYQKVGNNAADLRLFMYDNPECMAELDAYKSKKTVAMITGLPGGFLLGWPIGGYLGSGGEWEDSYNVMLAIAIPLTIVSIIFETGALKNLKKAVSIHNETIISHNNGMNLKMNYSPKPDALGINIVFSF